MIDFVPSLISVCNIAIEIQFKGFIDPGYCKEEFYDVKLENQANTAYNTQDIQFNIQQNEHQC